MVVVGGTWLGWLLVVSGVECVWVVVVGCIGEWLFLAVVVCCSCGVWLVVVSVSGGTGAWWLLAFVVTCGTWYLLVRLLGVWLFLVHGVVVVVASLWLLVGGGCM